MTDPVRDALIEEIAKVLCDHRLPGWIWILPYRALDAAWKAREQT